MNKLSVSKKKVLERARVVWKRDPYKERSVGSEDKDFRHYFGCGLKVCLKVWNIMTEKDLHPDKPSLDHYLHSLLIIKIYPKRHQLCQLIFIKCYKQAKRGVFQHIIAVAWSRSTVWIELDQQPWRWEQEMKSICSQMISEQRAPNIWIRDSDNK